jgi:DNA-binding response OmpR family regulator
MPKNAELAGIGEVLVVDDDPDVRELLVEHLRSKGLRVATAADGRAAIFNCLARMVWLFFVRPNS